MIHVKVLNFESEDFVQACEKIRHKVGLANVEDKLKDQLQTCTERYAIFLCKGRNKIILWMALANMDSSE